MNITCSQLDDLLFDGSPLAMETARRHAEHCAECAEQLASWDEISDTAATLQTTWQNDLLWPRIDRALREQRKRSFSGGWMKIAAAILLTVGLSATMWYALRVQTRDAAFDNDILRISALDEVERAEQSHLTAIRKLERLAEPKLDAAPTPLMVSYKEKLMLLDDAIAECEENIESNRQNAHLREQLLAMYSDKRQTLEDVLREENHGPNR
ncbi:MAG TPA: hypothetical protein VGF48_00725 [Thermoanaerobaculia bacterium]|jgi:hypothetical protein